MTRIERLRRRGAGQWTPSVLELLLVCIVGIALIFTTHRLGRAPICGSSQPMPAAEIMQSGMDALKAFRTAHGPSIDLSTDINATGLIGLHYSPITTTVGNLEAKRTTTNPNMAVLVGDLLLEAGVKTGDFIAVGASGSFPALILATLSAAKTLDLRVGLIVSLGASQFGANIPEFTWLEMDRVLADAGILSFRTVAATLGGDLDVARDLSSDARTLLQEKVRTSHALLILESDLVKNVQLRMSVYSAAADGKRIAAFVNVGGAWANMGIDSSILSVAPGVVRFGGLPGEEARGVMHAMAAEGVSIIHLLNIKDLVQRYGLPWDPSPLPAPGEKVGEVGGEADQASWPAVAYLVVVAVWLGSAVMRRRVLRR